MEREIKVKIIANKNEHKFASQVVDFINDRSHYVASNPCYTKDSGWYVAFIEYQETGKEQSDE